LLINNSTLAPQNCGHIDHTCTLDFLPTIS
jgi:hypothetical protein